MLTAVLMHLDEAERRRAMPNLAALVRAGGTVIMKIRHGPVPAGRRMFEITPEETIELARTQSLLPVLNVYGIKIRKPTVWRASAGPTSRS